MKAVIVIPTYNERENIDALVKRIRGVLPEAEFFFIDDNSPDGTAAEIKRLQQMLPGVHLIERPGKLGIASAYKTALGELRAGPADVIITMDADLSHDPAVLTTFIAALGEVDCVIGSRYVAGGGTKGWEGWRRFLSSGANIYARIITRLPIRDLTSGFVGFRRELLNRLDLGAIKFEGYAYQIAFKALMVASGARFREVPIVFHGREAGKSKISKGIIWEGVKAPWKIYGATFKMGKHSGA